MIEVELTEIEVELTGAQRSSSYNVSNSDDSYSIDISADLELPDITFTDSDGSSSSVPSVKNITATPCVTPDYYLPALSQTTSYRDYDEAWLRINYDWDRSIIPLDGNDFYTLASNNVHGNTLRFTKQDGTEPSTTGSDFNTEGEIIQDHHLKFEYIRMSDNSEVWNNYIDNAQAIATDGGGWYPIPAVVYALIIHNTDDPSVGSGLNKYMESGGAFWTSTTQKDNSNNAQRVFSNRGLYILGQGKTASNNEHSAFRILT